MVLDETKEAYQRESFEDRLARQRKQKKTKEKKKPRYSWWKKILIVLLVLFIMGMSTVGFLLYGPYNGFRDWLIPTAMTTLTHQWIATMWYSDETINDVMSRNRVIEPDADTDASLIDFKSIKDAALLSGLSEEEKAILIKDPEHEDYKIIDIEGHGYYGYLVAIYHPEKLKVAYTKNLGVAGQYVTTMAKDHNAQLAINGGGFYDPNYSSAGGIPQGTVIHDGKIVSERRYTRSGGLIGLDEDGKLILTSNTSGSTAIKNGIKEAVTFGPFLIVNGESSAVLGNGGWGTAPRTAIGQRADGIALLLVLNGRTLKYPGADMDDLIEIMERYGAINAANLDGGTSTVLVVDGELVNDPIDGDGRHQTRMIATAIYLEQ